MGSLGGLGTLLEVNNWTNWTNCGKCEQAEKKIDNRETHRTSDLRGENDKDLQENKVKWNED